MTRVMTIYLSVPVGNLLQVAINFLVGELAKALVLSRYDSHFDIGGLELLGNHLR